MKFIYIGLVAFLIFSCKHAEKVVIEKKLKPISVKRIVKQVTENELKFNTLSVNKASMTINNDGKVNSIRGNYKIKKDSVIQISAQKLTFPIGKFELNTDSFKVVYHIGKTLMKGSLLDVSEVIGNDIDFQTIQAILCNHLQSIRQDQKENLFRDYVGSIEQNMYKISSIRARKFKRLSLNIDKLERYKHRNEERHMVKQDIYIDPDLFVIRKVVYDDIDANRFIEVGFSDFKNVGEKMFPSQISISFISDKKFEIQIELSKITVNDTNDFGFSIPSKYKYQDLKFNADVE